MTVGSGRGGRDGRPTLEQVAAHAGVGRGTVSRVINGSPRVSDRTRTVVEAAIADLGYVPHRAARALAANRADAVALVVPESETRLFAEPYFAAIIRGVSAELAQADIQLLLTLSRTHSERERFAQYAASNRVDGALLVSVHGEDPLPELLAEYGVPAVMNGRRSGEETFPHVDCDNVGGARLAVAHLLARGREAVATITGSLDIYASRCRVDGYRQALDSAQLPYDDNLVAQGDFTEEGGYQAMRQLLDLRPDLDAVFCASDLTAFGARRALRENGRTTPDDVALVGFDDSAIARHMEPSLTSVRQPLEEMGQVMTRELLAMIAGEQSEPAQVVLPTELVRRRSS